MKCSVFTLSMALFAAPCALVAQAPTSISDSASSPSQTADSGAKPVKMKRVGDAPPEPFSRLAVGGGLGIGGVNMQVAVEANRYLNIRGIGNYFSYSVNNIKIGNNNGSSGANVSGKLNLAEAGIAADYYPWPNHGFRVSPGVTFYNQTGASASGVTSAGSSITLGSQKYYSDSTNPMNLSASLGLNAHPQTFSLTTGWGNMISRKGGHWAFPFEIGVIFTGAPTVGLNITGSACTVQSDAAINGPSCVNMATNTTAQTNIATQVAKYKNDVNPLQVWPILSGGISYNFKIR